MTDNNDTSELGQAIQDVTETASLLIREEIELAKTEVIDKVTKLIKGAVVGIAAGIFAVFGLIYGLESLAWLIWDIIEGDVEQPVDRLPDRRRPSVRRRRAGRLHGRQARQARLAAGSEDGDRGGPADQGDRDEPSFRPRRSPTEVTR